MTSYGLILRDVVKTFELPTIPADATVAEAVNMMLSSGGYTLLVPRSGKSDAYSVVTKRDVLAKVVAEGKDPSKVKVKEIMSKPLALLTNLSLDLRWVAKAMANSKVATIAVFDKGDFYGYATESCVVEGIYHAMRRAKIEDGVEFVSC